MFRDALKSQLKQASLANVNRLLDRAAADFALEPVPDPLTLLSSENLLKQEILGSDWTWIDPRADCVLTRPSEGGVQIKVPPNHQLWLPGGDVSAPRLLRPIEGDFVLETHIAGGVEGRKSGGLLVWQDERSYVRLELRAMNTQEGEVRLEVDREKRWSYGGLGRLKCEALTLRLERRGDRFSGYCTLDGEQWFSCGYVDLWMQDPVQIGIHATAPGSSSTSTRFTDLRIAPL